MLRAPQLHFSLKTCLGNGHGKLIRSELKVSKCDSCDSCAGFHAKGKQTLLTPTGRVLCAFCAEVPIKLLGEVVASSSSSLPSAAKAGDEHQNSKSSAKERGGRQASSFRTCKYD